MSDSLNQRQIQWFPGHMAKTLRLIGSELKNVDAVLVLLDARIPASSLTPRLRHCSATSPESIFSIRATLLTRMLQAGGFPILKGRTVPASRFQARKRELPPG